MTDIRYIGICTGGGDAPGLNAVIRAAVKCAFLKYNWTIIGIRDGFDGLIWPEKSYGPPGCFSCSLRNPGMVEKTGPSQW